MEGRDRIGIEGLEIPFLPQWVICHGRLGGNRPQLLFDQCYLSFGESTAVRRMNGNRFGASSFNGENP
jgi:hypothetical protein